MRKTKVALAAMALVASTAAIAQVAVSGRVEMSAQSVSGTDKSSANGIAGYNLAGSEIKFTGEEDIGNGLKANFYLATGFDLSRGRTGEGGESTLFNAETPALGSGINAQSMFNRGAWVGLSGEFGSVNLGRQYTLTTTYFGTGDVNASNSNHVMHMVASGMAGNFWADRAITYTAPSISGFTVSGQLIDADKTVAPNAGRGSALALAYSAGDLNVSYAQMRNGCLTQSGTCWTSSVLGANYTMGAMKFGAGMTRTSNADGDYTTYYHDGVAGNGVWGAEPKTSGQFISGNYTMDALVLGVSYYRNKVATEVGSSSLIALSARYNLSKRTQLFAQLNNAGKTSNAVTGYFSNYNGIQADDSKTARAVFAGVLHQF